MNGAHERGGNHKRAGRHGVGKGGVVPFHAKGLTREIAHGRGNGHNGQDRTSNPGSVMFHRMTLVVSEDTCRWSMERPSLRKLRSPPMEPPDTPHARRCRPCCRAGGRNTTRAPSIVDNTQKTSQRVDRGTRRAAYEYNISRINRSSKKRNKE